MKMRTVFKLVQVEMKDIKEGDRFIMFGPNGKLVTDDGQASFTALEDAKKDIDYHTQEPFWIVNVNMVRKQYEANYVSDTNFPPDDYKVTEGKDGL